MTEKRYAAWADGVCKTCGNYTHSCECEHPQSPLLDKLFGTAPPTPADAGTPSRPPLVSTAYMDEWNAYADHLERNLQRAREDSTEWKKAAKIVSDSREDALVRAEQAEQQLRAERERAEGLERVVVKAQGILGPYLPPDGISQDACINELLGLLDGPESREALRRKEQKV